MTRTLKNPRHKAIAVCANIAMALFWSSSAFSQDQKSVSVDTLIEIILSNNPDLEISESQIGQAEARVDSARAKYFPKPSSSVSYFHQNTEQNAAGAGALFAGQNGFTAKSTVQLNIFNGFQDRHRHLQRKKELEKSKQDLGATRLSQFEKAIGYAFEVLRLQSDIKNISDKLSLEREREKDLESKVSSQSAKMSDLLSVRASLLSSEEELETTRSELQSNWRNLRSLTNSEIPYTAIETPNTTLNKIVASPHAAALPDIRSARADLDASVLAEKGALGALAPSIDVSFNKYLVRPSFQQGNNWDLQFTASIPIPFDSEKRAALHEAELLRIQKEAALSKNEKNKQTEVDNLVQNYNADLRRQTILNEAVENQRKLVEAMKKDYKYGLVSISDYLSSISTLLQKRQQRDHLLFLQLKRSMQIQKYHVEAGEKS
jgi:outer membrane protein TolC